MEFWCADAANAAVAPTATPAAGSDIGSGALVPKKLKKLKLMLKTMFLQCFEKVD